MPGRSMSPDRLRVSRSPREIYEVMEVEILQGDGQVSQRGFPVNGRLGL